MSKQEAWREGRHAGKQNNTYRHIHRHTRMGYIAKRWHTHYGPEGWALPWIKETKKTKKTTNDMLLFQN